MGAVKGIDLAYFILNNSYRKYGVSNLELAKYIYLINHEFNIKFSKTLVQDKFIFKSFGPIIEEVYYTFVHNGANSIKRNIKQVVSLSLSVSEVKFIKACIYKYDSMDYWQMTALYDSL